MQLADDSSEHYGDRADNFFEDVLDNVVAATHPSAGATQDATQNYFLGNGSRVYWDGQGIEICTPECNDPTEAIVYKNANRQLMVQSIGRALLMTSERDSRPASARLYDRVVDAVGNSWATHDNFGLTRAQYFTLDEGLIHGHATALPFMRSFTGTRMVYAGAGHADMSGWHFSQKRNKSFDEEVGQCFGNTLLTLRGVDRHDRPSYRFESRDSDNPASDWPSIARLATMAGAVTLMASSYPLHNLLERIHRPDDLIAGAHNQMNAFTINEEGYMIADTALMTQAADFQLSVLDALRGDDEKFGMEVSTELKDIYASIDDYLQRFKRVAGGAEPVNCLAAQVDWAAKAELARHQLSRKKNTDDNVNPLDVARAVDIAFDTTVFRADPSQAETLSIKQSPAQVLRLRGGLGGLPNSREKLALVEPPVGPATARVDAMKEYRSAITDITWSGAVVSTGHNNQKRISFLD